MTDLVQNIREALAKISEWPWKIEQETRNCLDIHSEGKLVCQVIDNDGDEITDQMAADAEMIIRAAPWLSEATEEIERLHREIEKAIHQLDWMLAPGQTRKEALKILREAIIVPQKETP